jgi:hypothetical protein
MNKTVTVGQIAKALRCHERSARGYLSEVNERIDRYASNLGEHVDVQTVFRLWKRHFNTPVSRRLTPLLQSIR